MSSACPICKHPKVDRIDSYLPWCECPFPENVPYEKRMSYENNHSEDTLEKVAGQEALKLAQAEMSLQHSLKIHDEKIEKQKENAIATLRMVKKLFKELQNNVLELTHDHLVEPDAISMDISLSHICGELSIIDTLLEGA